MTLSNGIMYFIILTAGATLHQAGLTNVQTAQEAAQALRPISGRAGIGAIRRWASSAPACSASRCSRDQAPTPSPRPEDGRAAWTCMYEPRRISMR